MTGGNDNKPAANLSDLLSSRDGWKDIRIGRYRLEKHIGDGEMGRVFLAEDVVLKRKVAIKVIREDIKEAKESGELERFLREAQGIARLQHPNVVSIYDVVHRGGIAAIAMEYVSGGTMDDLIGRGKTLPVLDACRLIAEAADGLACAHENSMIHSDVKPANLMLTRNRQCKVADFGVAHAIHEEKVRAHAGKIVGTPYFISPEVIRGEDPSPASDIYALGIVLWIALAGKPAYTADSLKDMYIKHLKAPVPDIMELCPDVPESLKQLIDKCLAKDPDARISDASALAAQLRDIADVQEKVQNSELARVSAALGDTTSITPVTKASVGLDGADRDRTKADMRKVMLLAGTGSLFLVLVVIAVLVGMLGSPPEKDGKADTDTEEAVVITSGSGTDKQSPAAGLHVDDPDPEPDDSVVPTTGGNSTSTVYSDDDFFLSDGTESSPGETSSDTADREPDLILKAVDARLHGGIKMEDRHASSWQSVNDYVSWEGTRFKKSGTYTVAVVQAVGTEGGGRGGSEYLVQVGDQKVHGTVQLTGTGKKGFFNHKEYEIGEVKIDTAGRELEVACRATSKKGPIVMNLKAVKFYRVDRPETMTIPFDPGGRQPDKTLEAMDARLHINSTSPTWQLRKEEDKRCIGFWASIKDYASWDDVVFEKAGVYRVVVFQAGGGKGWKGGSKYYVTAGGHRMNVESRLTGGFQKFKHFEIGEIEIGDAGEKISVVCRAEKKKGSWVTNIGAIKFYMKGGE